MYDQAIINGRIYLEQKWQHKNIYIIGETIQKITDEFLPAAKVFDVKGLEVIPGVIDPHVHFELDLGWIKSVDTFSTGSMAAIRGGVTSVIDFLEPVDHPDELERAFHKRRLEAKESQVDYTFHATIKNPKCDLETFVLKMKSLGMHTLKFFTTYSDSGRRTYDKDIKKLLRLSKKHHFLLLAHIENDKMITHDDRYTHQDLGVSRPSLAETSEALKLASFVEMTKGYLYMVHLSSGQTLKTLTQQYRHLIGKHFFIESCPQYFTFNEQSLSRKDGYLYTFAPPLRTKEEQKLLFDYQRHIQTFGTDHCAFMKKDKLKKQLKEIPLGIGGVEFSLPIMRRHLGDDAIYKMTEAVANIQGLPQKGMIKEGYDADLVIIEPTLFKIQEHHGTCDYSVYYGQDGYGKVLTTMIRGKIIYQDGVLYPHEGRYIEGSAFKVENTH